MASLPHEMSPPTAADKHGTPLAVGDTVSFVYGGDLHLMDVTAIVTDTFTQLPHVQGHVSVTIPAGATRLEQPSPPTPLPCAGEGRAGRRSGSVPSARPPVRGRAAGGEGPTDEHDRPSEPTGPRPDVL